MKKRTHVIIMKIREGLNGVITGYHSCLKAKEFLTEHGIVFDSVNVLDGADGMAALQALGAKSLDEEQSFHLSSQLQ